jgi:flagellar biosynthesis/type III secretory pathway ATPase
MPCVPEAPMRTGNTVSQAEPEDKQALIRKFYTQLERMKTTFNTHHEPAVHLTTNTFTFDDGQVQQTAASNQLKGKVLQTRTSPVARQPNERKATVARVSHHPCTYPLRRLLTEAISTALEEMNSSVERMLIKFLAHNDNYFSRR